MPIISLRINDLANNSNNPAQIKATTSIEGNVSLVALRSASNEGIVVLCSTIIPSIPSVSADTIGMPLYMLTTRFQKCSRNDFVLVKTLLVKDVFSKFGHPDFIPPRINIISMIIQGFG